MKKTTTIRLLAAAALSLGLIGGADAATAPKPPEHEWKFEGLFGTFDRAALQRGFQVYKDVCASCHGLRFIAFRNLEAIGFSEAEVKALAAQHEIQDGPDDNGDMFDREGTPADKWPNPFPNDKAAAAANGGAVPPDLSLIVEARAGGPEYLRALLLGYEEAPEGHETMPGTFYNKYFGGNIGMPPPLSEGIIEYTDGTEATPEQMAHDVTSFLTWAAEPMLEERKQTGVAVVLFLIVLTAMLYAVKRAIWKDVH